MIATEVIQKVQLVEGAFTATEAADVVNALIDEKINFHKIQRWCHNEHDENCDNTYTNARIQELLAEKKRAKEILAEARRSGAKVSINGILEITFE